MIEPITIIDLTNFFNNLLNVFGSYIVYAFSIMVAFSLLFGIRKLILGNIR